MANPLFHYGVPVISFGCIALLVGRAASYGCGGDIEAVGEPTSRAPSSSSSSTVALSVSAAAPSASAAWSIELPNKEEWGGMSKSGRMLTPRPSTESAQSAK